MAYPTAWDCTGSLVGTVLSESCTVTATSSDPVISQDSGDLVFMLACVLFVLALQVTGMLFTTFLQPKSRK